MPDRYEAAQWYESVLGLSILPEYSYWAKEPGGPLMISPDGGNTKLALFERPKAKSVKGGGFDQVAFAERLDTLEIFNRKNERLTRAHVRDHHGSYSLHFCDPWDHRLELTTYDCEHVAHWLSNESDDENS